MQDLTKVVISFMLREQWEREYLRREVRWRTEGRWFFLLTRRQALFQEGGSCDLC